MEFICGQCGGKDWVFGDDSPLCWKCGVPLIKATQSYAGCLMSPEFVLRRMNTVMGKHGSVATGTGRFKREREACATAVYALGLSELSGAKYWVEIETVEQTPDTRVYQIDQSRGYNTLRRQNVEVVDWEQHVDEVVELVRAKCEKQYPEDFCLLIAGRSGKMVYPQVIARDIRTMTVPFAEIWILGQSSTNTFNVVRLHPTIVPNENSVWRTGGSSMRTVTRWTDGWRSPLMNKFSERAGERAQMQAKWSTRNREYVPVISGCLPLVEVMQTTDLR